MNSASKNKKAAWLFIQYFTGPEFELWAALNAKTVNPARKSVWDNEQFKEKLSKVEGYADTFQKTIPNTGHQIHASAVLHPIDHGVGCHSATDCPLGRKPGNGHERARKADFARNFQVEVEPVRRKDGNADATGTISEFSGDWAASRPPNPSIASPLFIQSSIPRNHCDQ